MKTILDTRAKIVSNSQVASVLDQDFWIVIAGRFDPLTAETAGYIHEIAGRKGRRKLFAFVLESPDSHLDAQARATLIAALRDVDLVSTGSMRDLPAADSRVEIFHDPVADEHRTRDFVELVHERQKVGS